MPLPVVLAAALAVLLGAGVIVWQWVGPSADGLRLADGEGRNADGTFAVSADGGGSNQVLNAVTSVGDTVVAVGSDTTSPVPRPLFLVSTDDGRTWRLGSVTGPAGYESTATTVGRVVGGDGKWLAAGNEVPTDAGPGSRGLWTSENGIAWTAVDPSELGVFQPSDKVADIARTSSGFVAAGTAVLDNGTEGPVVWTSPDGRSWTRIEAKQIGDSGGIRGIKAVAARGKSVVALAEPGSGGSTSVILRSADGGRTWTRTGAALKDVTPRTGALAALDDTFVLVPIRQRSDKGEVRVYCSGTGREWRRCGTIGGLARDGVGVLRLSGAGSGVAAVAEAGWQRYTVYTSSNGKSWQKRADLGELSGTTLRALTVSGGGTLVVGGDRGMGGNDNRLVLMAAAKGAKMAPVDLGGIQGLTRVARETTRLAVSGDRFVAVGAAAGEAGIWTGAGGDDWRAAGPASVLSGPRRQSLADVAHGPEGWIAVGGTMTDGSSTRMLVVTSPDGETWKGVPAEGALAPQADHYYLAAHSVAAGEAGYVVAGEDRTLGGTSPVLWFTSDLRRFTRADKLPGGQADIRIGDVAATSEGFVAVGGSVATGKEYGVAWVSSDGKRWTQRERVLPPEATSAALHHVVARDGRITAVGTAQHSGARRTFSAVSGDDGETWEYAWLPVSEAASVLDLASGDAGLVAVGWHGAPGEGDSAAWASEDGLTWHRHAVESDGLGGDGAQRLGAVAASEEEVVALGRSTTYSADQLLIWRTSFER
ncbi:hypothetical protein SAMN05421505_109126 [Sinosporangium album]|uniref:Uncharacterized protein n=1 Tax=Sinosporangium album TaxID=504805 RepID=A0A1G7Y7F5_9ACTN|nr:hypothetical protein SAMN05421505_109126 [Sinosporangium album]